MKIVIKVIFTVYKPEKQYKGIDQLVADCQHNPSMVIHSLFPVFDAFRDRLQESNRKVNLYALEALQGMVGLLKDDLSGVLYHLVPAIVDNHLNSKNCAVYSAATGALCELVLNLDNSLLLEPFCFKARVLSGQAKVDLIEKVSAKFRCRQEGSLVVISRKSVPDQSAFISRMLACMANNGPNCPMSNGGGA
ncbi:unnamed protein product [Boreogadus saida]